MSSIGLLEYLSAYLLSGGDQTRRGGATRMCIYVQVFGAVRCCVFISCSRKCLETQFACRYLWNRRGISSLVFVYFYLSVDPIRYSTMICCPSYVDSSLFPPSTNDRSESAYVCVTQTCGIELLWWEEGRKSKYVGSGGMYAVGLVSWLVSWFSHGSSPAWVACRGRSISVKWQQTAFWSIDWLVGWLAVYCCNSLVGGPSVHCLVGDPLVRWLAGWLAGEVAWGSGLSVALPNQYTPPHPPRSTTAYSSSEWMQTTPKCPGKGYADDLPPVKLRLKYLSSSVCGGGSLSDNCVSAWLSVCVPRRTYLGDSHSVLAEPIESIGRRWAWKLDRNACSFHSYNAGQSGVSDNKSNAVPTNVFTWLYRGWPEKNRGTPFLALHDGSFATLVVLYLCTTLVHMYIANFWKYGLSPITNFGFVSNVNILSRLGREYFGNRRVDWTAEDPGSFKSRLIYWQTVTE